MSGSGLAQRSLTVVHPPLLDGAECLVVDRYASFMSGGLTEIGELFRTAKRGWASGSVRRDAADQLSRRVAEAVDCLPHGHRAHRAQFVVHVPLTESNHFAVSAVARGAAEALGIGVLGNALHAAANGPTSKGSSVAVKKSIIGSYRSQRLPGLPVIVVDDLVETGATFRAATVALRSGGAEPLANIAAVLLN